MTSAFGLYDEHSAFGSMQRTSNKNGQTESIQLSQVAQGWLGKAQDLMHDGDDGRGRTFIERAARLPYDEHEDGHPAAMVARATLFDEITDALEDAQRGDFRWLDAALVARAKVGEGAAAEITRVLAIVLQDYGLSAKESRRVREAAPDPIEDHEWVDVQLHDTAAIVDFVGRVLEAHAAYHRALWHNAAG